MKKSIFLLFGLMINLACTTSQPAPTSTSLPPTVTPPPTDTSIPPTQTPKQDVIELGEITFDGNECTFSGPTEVPTGEYTLVLNNLSVQNIRMGVVRLIDGKTYQDMVNLQSEPAEYIPFIPWISFPFYFTFDHEVYTYSLDEVGEHFISVQDGLKTHMWLCAPFQVIGVSSD